MEVVSHGKFWEEMSRNIPITNRKRIKQSITK
jgi:hypothetical protein